MFNAPYHSAAAMTYSYAEIETDRFECCRCLHEYRARVIYERGEVSDVTPHHCPNCDWDQEQHTEPPPYCRNCGGDHETEACHEDT